MSQLTAEEILHKKFPQAQAPGTGYNEDDVDDFLDEVAETVTELRALLSGETPAAAPTFAPTTSDAQTATGLLAMAARVHDEHIAEARVQAEEIVTHAQQAAEALVREAREASERELGDLEANRTRLQDEVAALTQFAADARAQVRGQLQALLDLATDPAPEPDSTAEEPADGEPVDGDVWADPDAQEQPDPS